MPEPVKSPGGRDDTRSGPGSAGRNSRAGSDQPVIDQRGTLFPRAARTALTRGAQPPARRPDEMPDLCARVLPDDWQTQLDRELSGMAATTRRLNRMSRHA